MCSNLDIFKKESGNGFKSFLYIQGDELMKCVTYSWGHKNFRIGKIIFEDIKND